MMRFIILLRLSILLPILLIAQIAAGQKEKSAIPSKKQRYESYKGKTARAVPELLEEARAIKNSDPSGALNIVEEALGISIAQGNVMDEAKSYILLGEINEGIGEWKLALENFTHAYEKIKVPVSKKNSDGVAVSDDLRNAARGMGYAYLKLGNYKSALTFLREALNLETGWRGKAERKIDISEVYYQMGDYDNAIAMLDNIELGKVGDETLEANIQNQRAKIYAQTNQVEKALSAVESSQNTLRSNTSRDVKQEERSLKSAKDEVADVLHEQERYDEEISFRNKSIEYNLENNNLPEVTEDKLGLGKAFAAKGETTAAIREFEDAVRIADTLNNPKEKAQAFLALAEIYEKNDRDAQALQAFKRYSEAVREYETQAQNQITERAELLKKQRDIESLSKELSIGRNEEAISQKTLFTQRIVIYGLLFIIAVIVITSYFIYKSAQASKTANQLLALKSLRSQMNPHFIFNALNSVNHFIAQNDERTANKFLSEFSRLMRLVLENSQEDFISLLKEQEIITLYLKLEHYRFRDKFDYEINIEEDINLEAVELPPMLVQPYIENAVWHGLRYKEDKGHLSLSIGRNANGLKIEVTDNGIGRSKSAELKTENQRKQTSTGLKNIQQRLRIINKVYRVNYAIDIYDLDPQRKTGTRVVIHLPLRKQTKLI